MLVDLDTVFVGFVFVGYRGGVHSSRFISVDTEVSGRDLPSAGAVGKVRLLGPLRVGPPSRAEPAADGRASAPAPPVTLRRTAGLEKET